MKRKISPTQKIGYGLLALAIAALIASLIMCYIGSDVGNIGILLFPISLLLFWIGHNIYKRGQKITESYFGNDDDTEDIKKA